MTPKRNEFFRAYEGLDNPGRTASEFIEASLDGSDYDRGQLESIQWEASNCKAAIGRLVQILYDKRVISRDDVYKVANQTNPDLRKEV